MSSNNNNINPAVLRDRLNVERSARAAHGWPAGGPVSRRICSGESEYTLITHSARPRLKKKTRLTHRDFRLTGYVFIVIIYYNIFPAYPRIPYDSKNILFTAAAVCLDDGKGHLRGTA